MATAAQTIYFMTYAIGAMNPLGILAKYGILDMVLIFPFQILGGLAGASFMSKIFWKQGKKVCEMRCFSMFFRI